MAPSTSEPSPDHSADELARAAEAEADAAQARAVAARARAAELRQELEQQERPPEAGPEPSPSPGPPGLGRQLVAPVLAALAIAALLAATGFMMWQHHRAVDRRQQVAEYAAAARQGVVNLMSIDYNTAKDSVQRVLDGSTGKFHDNFADTAEDFVKALQQEKVVTKATVNDAAVESITGDSAVVLVSATSRREGPGAPKDQQQPRVWRVVLNLQREGGQIKMSGVEFA
jgi:Mce-associated membrane protein